MLIRKIDKAKWITENVVNEPPHADALTCCLKTKGNTLSVWYIENEEDLEEAILAIVSGQAHLETIDVVILDDDRIAECLIETEVTEGDTPVIDLKKQHRDLSKLDFWTLGMVAEHIIESVKNDKIRRFRTASLKNIIKAAIENKRLTIEDLKEDVRKKIV
jgi:hypothetical protein